MATSTSKLGLVKPDYSDVRDVKVFNNNADKLDKFAVDVENLIGANKTVHDGKFEELLLETNIKGTRQLVIKQENVIKSVDHMNGSSIVRQDVFTYSGNIITERRTLYPSNKSLTFTYNVVTLETVVS